MTPRARVFACLSPLLALAVMSGCAAANPEPPRAPSTSAAETGIDAALAEAVSSTASALGVPGAVALVRLGDVEHAFAYGTRTAGGSEAVTVDDHVRIGSNTKSMTVTIVLQLAQEGLIDLEAPVSTYRDDVPGGENIPLRLLMNMRSGLGNYTEHPDFSPALASDPTRAWAPEELLTLGLGMPPYFAPGTGFHYSNTNTVLLGRIAEEVTGRAYQDLLRERIFEPFGLDDTSLPAPDITALPAPTTHGYMPGDGDELVDWSAVSGSMAWSAGGVVSTARDLADWITVAVDGDALTPTMQQRRMDALETVAGAPEGARYGWALADVGPLIGHTGQIPGFNSYMGRDTESDTTVVVWTNLASTSDGTQTAEAIAEAVTETLDLG